MQHYVKKLGRKNYRHELRSVRVFVSKTVTVIFLGARGRSGNLKCVEVFLYYRRQFAWYYHTVLWPVTMPLPPAITLMMSPLLSIIKSTIMRLGEGCFIKCPCSINILFSLL